MGDYLQYASTALDVLEADVRRVDTSDAEDRKSGQGSGNRADGFQSHRPGRVSGHTTVRGAFLEAYAGPGRGVGSQTHQAGDGIYGGDAVGLPWKMEKRMCTSGRCRRRPSERLLPS